MAKTTTTPRIASEPEAAPPNPTVLSMHQLSAQNLVILDKAFRRLREIVQDAEQRRADGTIAIELPIQNGKLTMNVINRPKWTERLC